MRKRKCHEKWFWEGGLQKKKLLEGGFDVLHGDRYVSKRGAWQKVLRKKKKGAMPLKETIIHVPFVYTDPNSVVH